VRRSPFLSLTRAWLLGIVRDRATIFWTFALPILFIVFFGLAFGRDEVGPFEVGLVVDGATPAGQALAETFDGFTVFKVSRGTLNAELAALKDGDRYVVVATEPAPSASAGAAPATDVVVYYDPSRGTASQLVLPIVRQAVSGVDRKLAGRPVVLTVDERSVRSSDLNPIDFFVPGVIGFSIMQTGLFAAIPFVQLRITRVLKRMSATPLPRWAVLSSQAVTRLILAVLQTIVLLLVGRLLFELHISSNILGVAAFIVIGGLTFLCLGLAISGLAKTEESVPALVQAVSFPMLFLSGVFWPIENFPAPIQAVSHVLPLTFLSDGLRQVMVGGASMYPLWVDYLVLIVWTAVAGLLAVRLFRWE